MKTPVALFIYNRPEHTAKVMESIREYAPEQLFIVADGPEERGDVQMARMAAMQVDWPCEVKTLFSKTNMGCDERVPSGIDWVFAQVERAIILEDDCVPSQSFFAYCDELLEKYKDDMRVHCISGVNTNPYSIFTSPVINSSYFFSQIPLIHGWATWRNRWEYYDKRMRAWPQLAGDLRNRFVRFADYAYWRYKFLRLYNGELTSWDGKWAFAGVARGALTISPTVNLVENISPRKSRATKAGSLTSPLVHPRFVAYTPVYEFPTFKYTFGINRTLRQKVGNLINSILPA